MKQFAAIVFSLLLIMAQTFAVNGPVSSSTSVAKPSCCGEFCKCCVSLPDAPSAPPVATTVRVASQNQFALPPVAVEFFTLVAAADQFPPSSCFTELRPAATPIFQRNCSLLI